MSKTNKISSMAPTHQADSLELYNDLIKSSLEEELINDVSQNEKEKKNRNIAISGDYGVGKSSIIRSFFHKNSNYKPLYVSLGSYIAKENINSNNYSEKEIEISILQQIIYSVEPSKLPFSRISRIDKKIDDTRCYCVIISLLLTILIILGICIINISKVEDLFNREWGANIFFGFTMILFLLLWWLLYYLMTNFSLKCISITTKDTEAELKKESFNDISILNKFVDELINFFISTKYEIIVFEDIDRLNKPIQIFSKLKEINSIINNAVKKKTIRFIYVIRDVIFDNAEIRTKFFDIIIPILPYSSTNTAYEKLEQDCKNILNLNLERSEYRKIGAFIDNYRYIADIVNEFQIFWNNIKNIFKNSTNNKFVKELKKDILFLVSYKVLYPKRFDLLYQNKGLISYYLSPEFKQEITQREKEKQIKRINYELSKATEKYMEEKKQYLDNFYEYLEETIPNFTRSDSAFYDENDNSILLYENIYEDDNINKLNNQKVVLKSSFMDQILTEEEIFKDGKNVFFSDLLNMHSDIDKLDKAKKNLNHLNYKTIDSKNVILYLEELYESYHSSLYYYSLNNENNTIDEEENSTIDKKENNTVNKKDNSITGNNKENIPNKKEYKNPYSYLNQFEKILINNDCLNDYTKKIINKKHNLALSLEDDYVLERIIKGNILEFDTKLDNAQMVLDEIDSTYFAFDYMCIKDIYTAAIKKYVVNKKISPEGKMFFENVFNNLTDYKLQFFKYLEDEKNSIFRYAFDYLDKVWDYIYDNGLESIDENLILFYFLLTIKYADSKAPPQNVFFYEAIENYNGIIQYLENNFKEISSKLSNFKIRFSPIVKFNSLISNRINVIEKDKKTELIENPNMMKLIYENDMFSIDLNHIMSICVALNFNYRKDRILESLKSNGKDNKIYLYLINNLSRTLNYFKDNNLIQNSSEIFLVELITENNLSISIFETLLFVENNYFNNLSRIDKKYYLTIQKYNKYKINWNNIYTLYNAQGLNDDLIKVIEENKDILKNDFNHNNIEKLCEDILKSNSFNPTTIETIVDSLMNNINWPTIKDISHLILNILINKNKIKYYNVDAYNKEVLANSNLNIEEKAKILSNSAGLFINCKINNLPLDIAIYFLNNEEVNSQIKVDFIFVNNYLLQNETIKNKIFNYVLNEPIKLKNEELYKILSFNQLPIFKIKIFNKYLEQLKDYSVDDILKTIGGECEQLLNKEKRLYFQNNEDTKAFLNYINKEKKYFDHYYENEKSLMIAYNETRKKH